MTDGGSSDKPPQTPKQTAMEVITEIAKALARKAAAEDGEAELAAARAAGDRGGHSSDPAESNLPLPAKSGRRPARFTEADIKRAIAGAQKAGLPIAQVRIDPAGNITVEIGEPMMDVVRAERGWDEAQGIKRPVTRSVTRKKR